MNVAIILAGGIGSRFGADRPKQFVEVFGKPVIFYTLDTFEKHDEIDAIEVVCHKDWKKYLNGIIKENNLTKVKWIANGGDTFQESVINGLFNLKGKISDNDIVLVHFAASPFVTSNIISDCIRVTKEKGNAISATDYFLLSGYKKNLNSVNDPSNYSDSYIDREQIACMSSPHGFSFKYIIDLYDEAIKTGIINTIEPHTTTLMYAMHQKVYFSLGSQINIKITNKEDLDLFESFVVKKYHQK